MLVETCFFSLTRLLFREASAAVQYLAWLYLVVTKCFCWTCVLSEPRGVFPSFGTGSSRQTYSSGTRGEPALESTVLGFSVCQLSLISEDALSAALAGNLL